MRQLASLASLKTEPYRPHPLSPSSIPRASVESARRSMDHLAHESKKLSSSRPPSTFSQHTGSLSRNSRTSPIKRVSSAWKPQGTPPRKDIPRHSLDITPTRTVVPPALVTDVPLIKRTSTTDLPQSRNQASSSSIASCNSNNVRPSRTGSTSSLDLKSSKVRLRDRAKEVNLAKIEEPPASSRSKKLISMKEKNERVEYSSQTSVLPIDSHLSFRLRFSPTSTPPSRHPLRQPNLSSPPRPSLPCHHRHRPLIHLQPLPARRPTPMPTHPRSKLSFLPRRIKPRCQNLALSSPLPRTPCPSPASQA